MVVRYRVEQLAAASDVSVDTVRYYQSLGLLQAPDKEGRIAWYGPEHVERIARVRGLQARGLTLAAVKRVVDGGEGAADAGLAAAVMAERDGDVGKPLTLDEFANRAGVPASLIQAVEREGIRLGRPLDGRTTYSAADIDIVRTALRLLEFGLPLGELLALARRTDRELREIATEAVELFDRHVRKPILDTVEPEEATTEVVEAFRELLSAVTRLVSHHFRSVLLEAAGSRIEEP
jgi:DNA-binding transcriptional MerR regulator